MSDHETVFCLGEPSPPCFTSLSSLKPITLRELKLKTHHRDRVIVLKTTAEPKRIASVISDVEDQSGDVAHLAVYNLPTSKLINNILPKDAYFAVKEPYYTPAMDRKAIIRIDHPSDLVQLHTSSSMIPSGMLPVSMPSSNPIELNELGCEAYEDKNWHDAVSFFSAGLCLLKKQDEPKGLRASLHRNRSTTRGHLGHHELALQDALASFSTGKQVSNEDRESNAKSFLCAGRAAYRLGNFLAAKQYFCKGLEFCPGAEDLVDQLHQTEKRLKEQASGEHDFTAMSNSATEDYVLLDHASFLSNTKIASAGHRGRGIFAAKSLAAGDVIIVEKAFYVLYNRDVPKNVPTIVDVRGKRSFRGRMAERFFGITDKIIHNPKQARAFLDLHDGTHGQQSVVKFVDGMATVDTFRVKDITHLNSFGCPSVKSVNAMKSYALGEEPDGGAGGIGIWLHASHANHSCIPNAARSFIGDMMVVRATRDIKIGEEIFLSYLMSDDPYLKRKEIISHYGFECDCALCATEKSLPLDLLSKRTKLVEEFHTYKSMIDAYGGPSEVGAGSIEPAEDLMKQLEDTYPEAQYQHLPRLELVQFGLFMCKFNGKPEENLNRALRALRDLGYFVEIDSDGAKINRSTAVNHTAGIVFPVVAAAACSKIDRMVAAFQMMELRKEIYVNLFASLDGLDEVEERLSGQYDGVWE